MSHTCNGDSVGDWVTFLTCIVSLPCTGPEQDEQAFAMRQQWFGELL